MRSHALPRAIHPGPRTAPARARRAASHRRFFSGAAALLAAWAFAACLPEEQLCDGVQQRGELRIDAGFDRDGDGFFNAGDEGCVAFYGPDGLLDCDDLDRDVNPDMDETRCNGLDDDCDPATVDSEDADGDGFDECTDCDEADPAVNPGAGELCDGLDNNCDGRADEDSDLDGFDACGGDCDDSSGTVYPGAPEICDGLDSDCDGAATHPGEDPADFRCIDTPFNVRVAAANLSTGNNQEWQEPGIRILQGLAPDIVLIQEFKYLSNSEQDLRRLVNLALGEEFYYARVEGLDVTLPNGVISRWPILERGTWEDTVIANRNFFWVRVGLPSGQSLWAVSLHWSTQNTTNRTQEAQELAAHIRRDVPEGDLLVIGGDLNTNSLSESSLNELDGLVSRVYQPEDEDGNPHTNAGRDKPYDWVLPDEDLELYHRPVELMGLSFPEGLVFDSRVFSTLPPPVLAEDSAALNMQHMAVVKDFFIDWIPE